MHQEIFASKNGVIQRIISLTPLRSAYEQTTLLQQGITKELRPPKLGDYQPDMIPENPRTD